MNELDVRCLHPDVYESGCRNVAWRSLFASTFPTAGCGASGDLTKRAAQSRFASLRPAPRPRVTMRRPPFVAGGEYFDATPKRGMRRTQVVQEFWRSVP